MLDQPGTLADIAERVRYLHVRVTVLAALRERDDVVHVPVRRIDLLAAQSTATLVAPEQNTSVDALHELAAQAGVPGYRRAAYSNILPACAATHAVIENNVRLAWNRVDKPLIDPVGRSPRTREFTGREHQA